MHADEVATGVGLVRRLLETQFPDWAGLPVEPVPGWGTDNALYRLGDDMVVRLPRIHWTVGGIEKDAQWLPRLAPLLPVEVPEPLGVGAPAAGYPWTWGVYRWLEGTTLGVEEVPPALGREVARFVKALRAVQLDDPPLAGRAGPLSRQDVYLQTVIPTLEAELRDAVASAWDRALRTPVWTGEPVWAHGDLLPGNLVLRDGRLTGVLDFGGAGVGDPACDLLFAWVLPHEARELYRSDLDVDDATWERGRGWAVAVGAAALPYYTETYPALAATARVLLREALAG